MSLHRTAGGATWPYNIRNCPTGRIYIPPTIAMVNRLSIDNRLENLRQLCTCLKGVGDAALVPFLTAPFGILVNVLETVQNIRQLKDNFCDLAETALNILLAVKVQANTTNYLVKSDNFLKNISILISALESILQLVRQASSSKWTLRLWKMQSFRRQIQENQLQLDNCMKIFGITSLMELQYMISFFTANQMTSNRTMEETAKLIMEYEANSRMRHLELVQLIQEPDRVISGHRINETLMEDHHDNVRIFSSGEVISTSAFMNTSDGYRLYHAELGLPRVQAVLVKYYGLGIQAQKSFLCDLAHWREQGNPHLLQIMGCSHKKSKNPYIVFTGVQSGNVRSYMQVQQSRSVIDGFMTTLQMIQGLTSAFEYMANNCQLTKEELSRSTQIPNLMVNTKGQIILGRNMLETLPARIVDRSAVPYDTWLTTHMWNTVVELLFGNSWDFGNWHVVGGFQDAPYLRALLKYTAFYTDYSMMDVALGIEQLYRRLSEKQMILGSLAFPQLRYAMMQSSVINHNHVFRPATPITVSLGDLGYINVQPDGTPVFIKLDNLREEIGPNVYHDPLTVISSFPDPHWDLLQLPDGSMRYTFKHPRYVHIRRLRSSTFVDDHKHAWQFMIENAGRLEEMYCAGSTLKLEQIILVVGIEEELRRAYFDMIQDDMEAFEIVHFHEDAVPQSSEWGHWTLGAEEEPLSHNSVDLKYSRSQQNIAFVQLDQGEWQDPLVVNPQQNFAR